MPENLVRFPPIASRGGRSVGQICTAFLEKWYGTDVAQGAEALAAQLPEHVPGALRLVIARALRQLDVPPFASVEEFRTAVSRFAERPVSLHTISDVRRARRNRRTTLSRIAEQTGLPVQILRQLEWGDFRDWRDGAWTESVVRAYARAAELDESRVLAIVEEERETQLVPWVANGPAAIVALRPPTTYGWADETMSRTAVADINDRSGREAAPFWLSTAAVAMLAVGLGVSGFAIHRAMGPHERLASTSQAAVVSEAPRTESDAREAPLPSRAPERRGTEAAGAAHRSKPVAGEPALSPAVKDSNATFSPAFSNAGSAVFYHRDEGTGSALMKAEYDTQTGDLRVINIVEDGARNYHVRPSPDGTRLAFDSDRDGERGVYVATADGQNVQRVSGPGFAAVPSWSPDGTHLAYVRAEADGRTWNLWLLDLQSRDARRLTAYRFGQPWGASWFPDGRRLAYTHEDQLKTLDLATGATRTYKTPHAGRLMRTPAVSPDGRHVAFQVYRDGAWLLDLRDGSMQRILNDPTAEEFAWDSAGRRLAFHSRRSGQWSVWIMATPAS